MSIADIVRGMMKRFVLLGLCLMLGVLAGVGIMAVNAPQYASEAQIMVANLSTPFDKATNVQEQRQELIDDRFVLSQVSVLKSQDLAERVIAQLQLEGKGEFDPLRKGMGTIKQLMVGLGFGSDPRLIEKKQRAIEHLVKNLAVYQVPLSNVIVVRFTALDGKTAAAVANSLSETYVLSTRESQSGPNGRAREWLAAQIAILRKKVSESEAAVERFRADAGLLKGQTTTLGSQEISELNSQITLAEAASSEAAAKADEIRSLLESQGSVDASAEVLSSQVIQRLREQQVTVTRKISELSATYLPNHPKMVAANRELADVNRQVRREALKIVDSLQGQAKVAEARADSLRRSLEDMKTREGGALQSDVKLKELEREAMADRTLLESMLGRYADANARQDLSVQPGFARVIQTASVAASPFFPKLGPTILLTTFAGLGLGLGLAFLLEVIKQSGRINELSARHLESQGDRSSAQGHPHVMHGREAQGVAVPDLDLAREDAEMVAILRNAMVGQASVAEAVPQLLASLPAAPPLIKAFVQLEDIQKVAELAEPIARLAAGVVESAARSGAKSFCITSIGGTYDAAFSCVALARALAALKVKTVVLDLVPSRPSAIDLMALPDGPGLVELVQGQADVAKVIVRDHKSNVQMIRHGQAADTATRGLLAAKMPAVLASLAQVYDIILVNAGEASPATPDLMQGMGAVIFLAAANRQKDAAAAARSLAARGVRHALYVKLEPRDAEAGTLRQAS
jgi:uncharacterized protein involved in exopolysaccharide biosynthesis/Mrp family chromosome partitioning ATPase